ncbi:MAG: adenosine deaminase [Vulcanimicrobiaceae bacterium]
MDLRALPKAELHLHIEGTFEPEAIFAMAERNGVTLKYPNVEALRHAYAFTDPQSFLDCRYDCMRVLQKEEDFYELTAAYLLRAHGQNVRHAEIFFDPQAHTQRGVSFHVVVDGIRAAMREAERERGITSHLILCFLRDRPVQSARTTLEEALAYGEGIVGVGLDSAERGNPPSKFSGVFDQARAEGFLAVAHAGEEGPPAYIWEALDLLKVRRIDHGVVCMQDGALVQRLVRQQTPLTVCPLSNLRLRVVDTLADHPLKAMLEAGLCATINSDDPAYFGGYVTENYEAVTRALLLDGDAVITLAKNSFQASFLDDATKRRHLLDIEQWAALNVPKRTPSA